MDTKQIKLILTGAMLVISAATIAQEDKKSKKARVNLEEAKQEANEAHADSAKDYHKFKEKADRQNVINRNRIAELKEKNKIASKEVKEVYEKKLMMIENKNEKLKKQLAEAYDTKTSKWNEYKREFNHDMDELEKAINELLKDNVK
jgi:hypothetical protein